MYRFSIFWARWIRNLKFVIFWNFWVSRSLMTSFMARKPWKTWFSPKLSTYSGLSTGPGLTDFQVFGLVGFAMEKSWFPENFSSPWQLCVVWGLYEPKSPKTTSSRVMIPFLFIRNQTLEIRKKKFQNSRIKLTRNSFPFYIMGGRRFWTFRFGEPSNAPQLAERAENLRKAKF